MHNYKLLIAYDGTHFGGWQIQPNAVTVQQRITEAAEVILRQPINFKLVQDVRTQACML